MPQGKAANQRCAQLTDDQRCRVFGQPERPGFCAGLRPSPDMCGTDREHALRWLSALEQATRPAASNPMGRPGCAVRLTA